MVIDSKVIIVNGPGWLHEDNKVDNIVRYVKNGNRRISFNASDLTKIVFPSLSRGVRDGG